MKPLNQYLKAAISNQSFERLQAREVMQALLSDGSSECKAALLSVLSLKGVTAEEMLGFIDYLIQVAEPLSIVESTLDIVGTGGDFSSSVNISTGAAIIAAAAGVRVLKHGNRSVSSLCGSADVLEALQIKIDMDQAAIRQSLDELNIAFVFALKFHQAYAKLKTLRNELQIPTILNQLGPLLNPAEPTYRMIGVGQSKDVALMVDVVRQMPKIKRAFVFHSEGLDELHCGVTTNGYLIEDRKVKTIQIDPKSLGFASHNLQDIKGGDPKLNADLLISGLKGLSPAITDTLILNAGVALYVAEKAIDISTGIQYARTAVSTGAAYQKLQDWIHYCAQPACKEE